MEATRLAVYFEETGAYHHKLKREQERQSGSTPTTKDTETIETGWDEEDDEEEDWYGDG